MYLRWHNGKEELVYEPEETIEDIEFLAIKLKELNLILNPNSLIY